MTSTNIANICSAQIFDIDEDGHTELGRQYSTILKRIWWWGSGLDDIRSYFDVMLESKKSDSATCSKP